MKIYEILNVIQFNFFSWNQLTESEELIFYIDKTQLSELLQSFSNAYFHFTELLNYNQLLKFKYQNILKSVAIEIPIDI